MKTCRICNTDKPLSAFSKDGSKPDGLCFKCKACMSAYLAELRKFGPKGRQRTRLPPEEIRRRAAEKTRQWRKDNPERKLAITRKEQAAKLKRTPPWADQAAIIAIYQEAASRRANGEDVHVDHVLPLCGRLVSGLHVAANLRIIPARENLAKGCKFDV
jgi:hypothetical protein